MRITARFICNTVTQIGQASNDQLGAISGGVITEQVTMSAIYSSSPNDPNLAYSKATPNAELKMTVTNSEAFGAFKPGHIYDLVFDEHVREPVPFNMKKPAHFADGV